MIKINVDNFDMDIIQNVYMDKKNGVITKTTDKIRNYIEGRNKNQTLVEIYKKMFGENISEEEIGNLLLGKKDRLEKYIRIYKGATSEERLLCASTMMKCRKKIMSFLQIW